MDKATWKEKQYIRCLEAMVSLNFQEGVKHLEKIVERDPHDKEAFLQLGWAYSYLETPDAYKKATRYLLNAIDIDPLYKRAYDGLTYVYNEMGDFENSLWAINKFLSLAPEEPSPYQTRAQLYALNGKTDLVIESSKKALMLKPDFLQALAGLGYMYLYKREYPKAEGYFQELFSIPEKFAHPWARICLAFIPLYEGKFEDALQVLDQSITADRMEQAEGIWTAYKHYLKTNVYETKGNLKKAEEECIKGIEIPSNDSTHQSYGRSLYIKLLAGRGQITKAKKIAHSMKKGAKKEDPQQMIYYWEGIGFIERAQGNYNGALANFEKATKYGLDFHPHYTLGQAYLEVNRLAEAVAEFEKILSRYSWDRLASGTLAVKAYYLLGLAYEKSGWNNKAIENYQEFLDIWKNADPGITEVEDAKQRLAILKKKV